MNEDWHILFWNTYVNSKRDENGDVVYEETITHQRMYETRDEARKAWQKLMSDELRYELGELQSGGFARVIESTDWGSNE